MGILATIEAFFIGPVYSFLKPFISTLESQGSSILIAAAEAGVAAGFATTGGGTAAMAAALGVFETQVTTEGLPFIESQARALIEVALQNVKTATATAVPAPVVAPTLVTPTA